MQLEKGNKTKINFDILKEKVYKKVIDKQELEKIIKFDKEYNGEHIITQIYSKNLYTDNVIKRIELDKQFVFYEDELIRL